MACIENISVDVTVFMGSYKFVNIMQGKNFDNFVF